MGKRGSWFSAIRKVFVFNSKEKSASQSEKKNSREKKGRGTLRPGETKSFIPLFREPSSIEKILCEADEQKLLFTPPTTSGQPKAPPVLATWAVSPRISSPPRGGAPPKTASPRVSSPKTASHRFTHRQKVIRHGYRPEPTLRNQHLAATKIQAFYRGYMARRGFRALRGLVRLRGVLRGQNVKRQTANAMRSMQLLVRVQTQIQSRRIQMLENQALQHQAGRDGKDIESTFGKRTQINVAGQQEDWDDSLLTKEQMEARLHRKVEAVMKRERAMAYAYSHQLWNTYSKSAQAALMDFYSSGHPWWWTWLERQLTTPDASTMKNSHRTPPRPASEYRPSPQSQAGSSSYKHNYRFNNRQILTPNPSTSPSLPTRITKQIHTPTRTPPANNTPTPTRCSRPRASAVDSTCDASLRDDDSLTSCPPFSVPNYMIPTVSAKAKVRASSNPKDRINVGTPTPTPTNESKRRFSFPLTPNIGPFKWNRGSTKNSTSQKQSLEKHHKYQHHRSQHSIGDDMSVDSAISMPTTVGRRPFNRFV